MQAIFWAAIIIGILALICGVFWWFASRQLKRYESDEDSPRQGMRSEAGQDMEELRAWARGLTLSLAGLVAVLTFFSSFWIVGTQNVGVVRSLGKTVGIVSNGPQWTYPWEIVTDMDYSVQVTDFTASDCQVQLRLADGQTACAKVGVRWQINTKAAELLLRRYKGSTQGVENGVLIPALQTAANEVFGTYNPVNLLSSKVPVGQPGNPSVPQLAKQVQAVLNKTIGSEVKIDLLNIPNITYAKAVQDRMNRILQQKSDTIAAQLAEQTAEAQAAANRTISASVSHDPNVLTARCLNLMDELIKSGGTPPVNMCNLSGSGASVIVGGGK
jgi:regulator of protease activity HflC (stomatin/prohibitin superfamily)